MYKGPSSSKLGFWAESNESDRLDDESSDRLGIKSRTDCLGIKSRVDLAINVALRWPAQRKQTISKELWSRRAKDEYSYVKCKG